MQKNSSRFTRPAKREDTEKQAPEPVKSDITVVILAGTPGYRMKSYGIPFLQRLPNGSTLMEHQIETIRNRLPNSEIIVSCSSYVNKISKSRPSGVRIVENQLEDTNEVEEMRLSLNNCTTEHVLFICGDIFFDDRVLEDANFNKSFLLYDSSGMMGDGSIGMTVVNNKATIMSFGIENKWGRIFFAKKNELKIINSFCRDEKHKKLFISEAINYVLERTPIVATNPECTLYRIETASDIRKMPEDIT